MKYIFIVKRVFICLLLTGIPVTENMLRKWQNFLMFMRLGTTTFQKPSCRNVSILLQSLRISSLETVLMHSYT